MKKFVTAILITVLSVGSMASKCQPVFERKCEEASGTVKSDQEKPEKLHCVDKNGKEITL